MSAEIVNYFSTSVFYQALVDRMDKTPDFPEFRHLKHIVLFVYDNLRYGTLESSDLLSGAQYLGKAVTIQQNYVMKETQRSKNSPLPVVFEKDVLNHPAEESAVVRGDAFLVSPRHILCLDKELWNTECVNRKTARICLKSHDHKNLVQYFGFPSCKAFMYLGDRNSDTTKKISWHRSPLFKNNSEGYGAFAKPYYEYTNDEIISAHTSPKGQGGLWSGPLSLLDDDETPWMHYC